MNELQNLEMFCNRTVNTHRWFHLFDLNIDIRNSYTYVSSLKAFENGWFEHNGDNQVRLTLDGIIKGVEEGFVLEFESLIFFGPGNDDRATKNKAEPETSPPVWDV